MSMSDNVKNESLESEGLGNEDVEVSEGHEDAGCGEAEPEDVRGELDALNDKYIRLYAEYENFRKRTAKEKDEIYANAAADVLKNILPVMDNFERALQFTGDEPEKVLEGLQMIGGQFAASLSKIGVEEIPAAGERFDPERHYAVAHEKDESQLESTVTEVLQKGYLRGGRVIRPAMVKVVN